ncbi:hypothetical protein VC83_03524 [Pseudogymnoascus destructans]|uniref:Uncharacterized protein n=2 Tax=Pseudogymnoascus destructans TaxID=655981 RepID=L8G8M4_PSED2|nr:uncharacterized protein VC83_03524 [Pseudogymnoascus destructans]ELR08381.1 hypothetical protein GMDG_03170 [Pseudogymnoascus destructans 20631-21]OAF60334.1 hypothetical protein VC83_03524 [Pseudogymnoascus destructans]
MSIPGLGTSHLQQTKLSNEAVDLLEPLADWLSTLEFARNARELENLVHSQLSEKMNSLLTELGLLNKRYSVVRIPGPKSQQFYNSEGSAYIIPIRVEDGYRPTVDGRPLVPGEITYMTTAVMVSPKLDLLFVLE